MTPRTTTLRELLASLGLKSTDPAWSDEQVCQGCAEALDGLTRTSAPVNHLRLCVAVARTLSGYGLRSPRHVAAVLNVLTAPQRALPYTSRSNDPKETHP